MLDDIIQYLVHTPVAKARDARMGPNEERWTQGSTRSAHSLCYSNKPPSDRFFALWQEGAMSAALHLEYLLQDKNS